MTSHFLRGEELVLLPEKAMYWKSRSCLILADTHFGKITHFRKAGIAIPPQAAISNLRRFEGLLERHQPEEVIFMGDLFHSEMNSEWLHLKALLKKYAHITFHLVMGNHDIFDRESYRPFQLHIEPWAYGPFLMSHEPIEEYDGQLYNLAGHIHPGVRMRGPGAQSMRFPCFYFGRNAAILPAFGEFTGLHTLSPKREDEVYIVTADAVIKAA